MTQQHHTITIGQTGHGKSTSVTQYLALIAGGHPAAIASTATASLPYSVSRIGPFNLQEIQPATGPANSC